ncbi:hypothetical protein L3Q82_000877 [Scortum barcoo]|uniref:Uncharacterized protein n=1 Tax=Scortum barcoo TaxID=214431 RepID=A0ACB8WE76_9TELE|nr:hypothetical protein L3Q82_000877 [Scortum barcoo]
MRGGEPDYLLPVPLNLPHELRLLLPQRGDFPCPYGLSFGPRIGPLRPPATTATPKPHCTGPSWTFLPAILFWAEPGRVLVGKDPPPGTRLRLQLTCYLTGDTTQTNQRPDAGDDVTPTSSSSGETQPGNCTHLETQTDRGDVKERIYCEEELIQVQLPGATSCCQQFHFLSGNVNFLCPDRSPGPGQDSDLDPGPGPGSDLILILIQIQILVLVLDKGDRASPPQSASGPAFITLNSPSALCEVIMSLSANDLSELMELWEELNLTAPDNLSHVETLLCSGAISHATFLHVLSILYIFIFLVGLAANALVVWVNLRSDRNRFETHLYILNLAVADLCVVATLPVWVTSLLQGGRWPFGGTVCKLAHLVFSVNLFSSIFFLTCMSVDRYLSVTLFADAPDSWRKKVVRRLICILVWLLALAVSVPDTYFLQAVRSLHYDGAICRPVYPSDSPREWMVARRSVPAQTRSVASSRRIILTYIVVFLVCWLPFHAVLLLDTLSLLDVLPFSCRLENFLDVALHLTQCFSLVHCCINPILYNFLNRNYRYDLMKAFILQVLHQDGARQTRRQLERL